MLTLLAGASLGVVAGFQAAQGAERRTPEYVARQPNPRSTSTMRIATEALAECAAIMGTPAEAQAKDVQRYALAMSRRAAELANVYDGAERYTRDVDSEVTALTGLILADAQKVQALSSSASLELLSAAEEVRIDALGIVAMVREAQPPASYGG